MSLFRIIDDKVTRYIRENRVEDTPGTRIEILHKLLDQVEEHPEMTFDDRFKTVQAIKSEIAVQRVRGHLTQLQLF